MEPNPAPSAEDEQTQRQTAPVLPNQKAPQSESPVQSAPVPEVIAAETNAEPEVIPATNVEPTVDAEQPTVSEAVAPVAVIPAQPSATEPITKRRRKLSARPILILVLVINLLILGGNGYVYANKHKTDKSGAVKTVAVAAASPSKQPAASTKQSETAAAKTLHYKSDSLNLEFDYPVDWRIASDSSNSSIHITSSSFKLQDVTGTEAAATINLLISSAAQSPNDFSYVGDEASAITDSEPLTYSHPTTNQRSQTNLSFIGYPHTDGSKTGIETVFVSGSNAYKAGEKVGSKDYKKVDPRISLYVDLCASGQCQQALIESQYSIETWHSSSNLQQAKAVIESMRFN